MSPDLRELLHTAAPRPAGAFDAGAVERRARMIGVTRVALATLAALAVASGSVLAASLADRPPAIDDVRLQPAPPQPAPPQPAPSPREIQTQHRERPLPEGRRHVIASGNIGRDWGEPWEGDRWELVVWGDARGRCWQLRQTGSARNEGRSCTYGRKPRRARATVFGASMSSYTGSRDADEYLFLLGETGLRVHRLEFRGEGRRIVDLSVPLHSAPRSTGILAYRYYATTLPAFDYAELVALSKDGRVLSSRDLCGVGCLEQRERDAETEVVAFENAPVTLESAAAAFAAEAVGRAGIADQLGTYWSYRTISSDELVATFRTTECSAGQPATGYRCDPHLGAGSVDVEVAGDLFVVESAEGPMTEEQRAAVESFSAPVTDDVREWRPIAESFVRTGRARWEVAFLMVWTGNLGAPQDYGSMCRYTLYDSAGDVLHRSPDLTFEVRDGEHNRVTGFTTTVETRRTPADLVMDCDDPGPALSRNR